MPGSFVSIVGATSATCTSCLPGEYQTGFGSLSCLNCPSGTHSTNSGSITCEPCEVGFYSERGSSSPCFSCEGRNDCPVCSVGSVADDNGNCVPCARGSYAEGGDRSCTNCNSSFIQPEIGQAFCIDSSL